MRVGHDPARGNGDFAIRQGDFRMQATPPPAYPAAPDRAADAAKDAYRPGCHFTPARHWINDPNGLVWFDGEYHLFYQYNPGGDTWGDIGWGHAVSTDLLHWHELPPALSADADDLVFSGSAVVDVHNTAGFAGPGETALVAIYTAARRTPGHQRQHIAYSTDRGRTWTPYAGNPVLDPGLAEFRDPKVQWYAPGGFWLMAVVLAERRRVAFHASDDLKTWRHLSDFGPAGAVEGIWECPDLFPIAWEGGTAWVLKVDVFGGHVAGSTGGQYFVGGFDGIRFTPCPGQPPRWSDFGADFYAALSWNGLPDGAADPVWIGWMNNHRYAARTPTAPWRGAMSLPRRLALARDAHGLVLRQRPMPQLASLRRSHRRVPAMQVRDNAPSWTLDGSRMRWDIEARFALGATMLAREFALTLENAGGDVVAIGYRTGDATVFVDRTHAGLLTDDPDFRGRHAAPVERDGERRGELKLRILVDRCSVEVFVDDGAAVITDLVFPRAPLDTLALRAHGGALDLLSLDLWELA